MIVPFKVDEDYIKDKLKVPFVIVKSDIITGGIQFLIQKDNEICGYIRIYLKKDGTTNIDFSQVKNYRLDIESYFIDNNIKIIDKPNIYHINENKTIKKEGIFSSIGIDESGKGDLFGPLVTVSAYVPGDVKLIAFLVNSGVKDSKKISDRDILKLFDLINDKKEIYWRNVTVKPKKYNELYDKIKNLNKLLAWEHARSLENLLTDLSIDEIKCDTVIADQFEDNGLVEGCLMTLGKKVNLIKTPKAESYISVAVASIIARALFLKEMKQLSEELKCVVPKGASQDATDFAIELKFKIGAENLDNYIKMHFKNVKEVIDK